MMDNYAFMIALAALCVVAAGLMVEYVVRRRAVNREAARNRLQRQQLTVLSGKLRELNRALARKSEVAEKLPQITKKLTEKLPAEAYPAIAVRSAKQFFHAERVGYFAPAADSSEFTLVVGAGFPAEWRGKVRCGPGGGMLGLALRKRAVVSRTDAGVAGQPPAAGSIEDLGVVPDFAAPVLGIAGVAGLLVVAGCPFPLEEERPCVSLMADQLSMALQNAALLDSNRNGAVSDPLTGVANRLHFLQRFESEIRRTENYRQATALLLFDVDHFKQINDTRGHHAGDVVIRRIAELVKLNTRSSDLVGRFGGDEFMVLITSTTAEQAVLSARKLLDRIAATDIKIPGSDAPVRVTASGGLAMFPVHGQSTGELFQAADDALYESKRQGRDRVTVASSDGLLGGSSERRFPGEESPPGEDPATGASDAVEYSLGEIDRGLRQFQEEGPAPGRSTK